ncbi:VENN motif pre-toxin domain-containing protein, partial [Serratia microhaemolytica]|uniref:VENN motif pre-toxin domain-containing protein n=1 Tax=Serratia microhaemolytica TaxID=2675110 RepID=UPI0013922DAD
ANAVNDLINLANSALGAMNRSDSDNGTTQAAISAGTLTVRDNAEASAGLSRDTANANGSLETIFDKEKEQQRIARAKLITDITGQVADIARTEGKIAATQQAKAQMANVTAQEREAKQAELSKANGGQAVSADEVEKALYSDRYNAALQTSPYGTGGSVQRGIQAVSALISGLNGGNLAEALTGAAAPYLAEEIHRQTTGADGQTDMAANVIAHALLGALSAVASGNNGLSGAAAGASAELMANAIMNSLYPGKKVSELTEEEKQNIASLSTLAAGLAGGLLGDSSSDAAKSAQIGKNAVENNYLSVSEKTELELAKQALQKATDPAEKEKAQEKINALIEKDISS